MYSCVSRWFSSLLLALFAATSVNAVEMKPVAAEKAYTPLSPEALEELVGPIALYPDDLVAIVLPASTFPLQVVQAARFREQDPDGKPSDRWDGSVVALLNYPEVLKKLNNDLDWTWRLGEAVINQQPDVLKAVSAFRERARVAGNLKSDDRQIVEVREKIVYIRPVRERVIYVPYYDPWEMTRYGSRHAYRYYPEPCPVYYYPYDDYWDFPSRHFWGVSTWYGIGWHHNRVHWLHHSYRHHPYYGRTYRDHGRWRSYRHQDAPAYVNQPEPPLVANDVPLLPEGSIWQPGQQAGSRPLGDRREHPENPVGPIGGYVPGGGGESAVTIPQEVAVPTPAAAGEPAVMASPSLPAASAPVSEPVNPEGSMPAGLPAGDPSAVVTPTQDAPVVYEGDINGERVRVIRRGSSFGTETVDSPAVVNSAPAPVIHQAPEPVIHQAPAPVVQEGSPYGAQHEAEIQAAIERAREQAREQSAIYERQRLDAERAEADRFRSEGSRGFDTPTFERRVETPASEPVFEPRREVIDQPSIQESRGGWGNEAAIEEAISRARDQGFGREESQQRYEPSSGSSWGREEPAESRDWRREERFESPGPDWGGGDSRFEPAREERAEPAWQPRQEEQQQIQIDDIRVEGQQ